MFVNTVPFGFHFSGTGAAQKTNINPTSTRVRKCKTRDSCSRAHVIKRTEWKQPLSGGGAEGPRLIGAA